MSNSVPYFNCHFGPVSILFGKENSVTLRKIVVRLAKLALLERINVRTIMRSLIHSAENFMYNHEMAIDFINPENVST